MKLGKVVVASTMLLTMFTAGGHPASAAEAKCLGQPATIVGTGGDDRLQGTPEDDVIAGLGGDDEIAGLAGNDLICGGRGSDLLSGDGGLTEAPADEVPNGDDTLVGGRGNDGLYGDGGSSGCSGNPGGADIVRGGRGADGLWGYDGADSVSGGHGHDKLYDGGDSACARARSDDFFHGGPGTDTIQPDRREAPEEMGVVIDLGAGALTYQDESVDSLVAIENAEGTRYDDHLIGDDTANYLDGWIGDDRLDGREGPDDLVGHFGSDNLDGGSGRDTAVWVWDEVYNDDDVGVEVDLREGIATTDDDQDSLAGIENIDGTALNDVLVGNGNRNFIRARSGDDVIRGRRGRDTLIGGWRNHDKVYGGRGKDTCRGGELTRSCERR